MRKWCLNNRNVLRLLIILQVVDAGCRVTGVEMGTPVWMLRLFNAVGLILIVELALREERKETERRDD